MRWDLDNSETTVPGWGSLYNVAHFWSKLNALLIQALWCSHLLPMASHSRKVVVTSSRHCWGEASSWTTEKATAPRVPWQPCCSKVHHVPTKVFRMYRVTGWIVSLWYFTIITYFHWHVVLNEIPVLAHVYSLLVDGSDGMACQKPAVAKKQRLGDACTSWN